jgi:hypothetical protein
MKNHNKDNLYVLTVQYLKQGIFIYLPYLTKKAANPARSQKRATSLLHQIPGVILQIS